jgi:heat-inducible transcriptional repressor
MHSVNELCLKGALNADKGVQTIFVEGVANLLASELDRERLRQMFAALEAKQRMVDLLNAYVDARQQTVRVVVGLEETIPGMQNLVLIGSPTRLGNENFGTVAVIGPTRMQYQETMNAVSYIAQLSEKIFQPPQ